MAVALGCGLAALDLRGQHPGPQGTEQGFHLRQVDIAALARGRCVPQGGQQRGWYFQQDGKTVTVRVDGNEACVVVRTLTGRAQGVAVASENLQAAESRIRDTDMAAEMVSYVKNQILSQIMAANLRDEAQSWVLTPDGSYARDLTPPDGTLFNCHQFFMENPSLSGRGTAARDAPRLIPVQDDDPSAVAAAQ